jgi:hypothetical protein
MIHPIWNGLVSNPVFRDNGLASNYLSHGTVANKSRIQSYTSKFCFRSACCVSHLIRLDLITLGICDKQNTKQSQAFFTRNVIESIMQEYVSVSNFEK